MDTRSLLGSGVGVLYTGHGSVADTDWSQMQLKRQFETPTGRQVILWNQRCQPYYMRELRLSFGAFPEYSLSFAESKTQRILRECTKTQPEYPVPPCYWLLSLMSAPKLNPLQESQRRILGPWFQIQSDRRPPFGGRRINCQRYFPSTRPAGPPYSTDGYKKVPGFLCLSPSQFEKEVADNLQAWLWLIAEFGLGFQELGACSQVLQLVRDENDGLTLRRCMIRRNGTPIEAANPLHFT
eukprot:gene22492-biopygen8042